MSEPNHRVELSGVAIIVAAKNEEAHLKVCIDSLLTAARGEAEIIVVDDGSTDGTGKILEGYAARIRVLKGEGTGPGRARNLAVRSTDRPWIAFTDADCKVPAEWLLRLREGIDGRPAEFASVGGAQKIPENAGPTEKTVGRFLEAVGFVSDYLHAETAARPVNHLPSCNVLYARNAFNAVNGFNESLWPCEDLDLDLRLRRRGFKILFQPNAGVEHRRPETVSGFWRMMNRYGFAHGNLVKIHGPCQRLHLLPLAAPAGAAAWLWILARDPSAAAALLLCAMLLCGLFFAARTRSMKDALFFVPMLFGSVAAWLAGFYRALLKPGRRIAEAG